MNKRKHKTLSIPGDSARELLLDAAKKCFAERGFDGTTIRDICERSGVNTALVSYHFGGKEALYLACLGEFGKRNLAAVERVLQPPKSREELRVRLEMFIEEMLDSYAAEPELNKIIHQECEAETNRFEDLFRNTFLKVLECLVRFFKGAHRAGLLNADADPQLCAGHFFSVIMHATRSDGVSEKYLGQTIKDPRYRGKFVDSLLHFTLEGVSQRPEE